MSVLFQQTDFSGGLNTRLDSTKTGATAYPLLVNGRIRKNVVSPTNRHGLLAAPTGNYQGLYVIGSYLVLFIDGAAYSADITATPILFHPVANWVPMGAGVDRIYAEQAPATANRFNKQGVPNLMEDVFNNALAIYPPALYCFDGLVAQAILPGNVAQPLGSYSTWTKSNPLYVPAGVLPAFAGNKLYIVAPDRLKIYHSVSGRPSDFVIALDIAGNKVGDATAVEQTVSMNEITAMRPLSTGEVLIGTLYGTFVLIPDYSNKIFGEPYLQPRPLFPAGPINEISIVDILEDTAFITQSGIHAFNAVAQAQQESNNFPLGAQIRGLLTNPNTEKAIVQSGTCAALYDTYALFAVNTIHGYGVLVYDTISESFQSLDLSFGRVKQFAVTKIDGSERIFFITHDNKIYEAFAETTKNVTRMLMGEWTPESAPEQGKVYLLNTVFTNVRGPGTVKLSFYADRNLMHEIILPVDEEGEEIALPVPLPFSTISATKRPSVHMRDSVTFWKCALMVEWDFPGELCAVALGGEVETADNVTQVEVSAIEAEEFAFFADSGSNVELNTGGNFPASGLYVHDVNEGEYYAFAANGDSELVVGEQRVTRGLVKAGSDKLTVVGTGAKTYLLRTADAYKRVLENIYDKKIKAIIHGGDFAYNVGTEEEVRLAKVPIRLPFFGAPGNHDIGTSSGLYYFSIMQQPRYYHKSFDYVDFFFFNSNSSEPHGISSTSQQAGHVVEWLKNSTKPFKILVCHHPLYSNDDAHYPGTAALRYLAALPGLNAVLSGHGHSMERFVVDNFPSFVVGSGGASLRGFEPNTSSAFRASSYGYLHIKADPLTCRLTLRDENGVALDDYALYA